MRLREGATVARSWLALIALAVLAAACREQEPMPRDAALTVSEIRALYAGGRPVEAREAALALSKDPPEDESAFLDLAYFLTRVRASPRAVALLRGRGEPDSARAREVLARALLKSGEKVRARALASGLIEDGSGTGEAHKILGLLAVGERDWEAARRSLVVAQRQSPEDPEAWAWLGWVLFKRGEEERAERLLRDACRRFPGSWEVRAVLSQVLYARAEDGESVLEEVTELCRFVARRHPFDRESRTRLASVLSRRERHLEAIPVYSRLAEDWPREPRFWAGLGIAQMGSGRVRAAVDSFEKALELRKGDLSVLLHLGQAYLELHEMQRRGAENLHRALETFEKARDVAPDDPRPYIRLARAKKRLGPGDDEIGLKAIDLYLQALEKAPSNFEANLEVAIMYYDLTVHAERPGSEWERRAREHFKRASAVKPAEQWPEEARVAYENLKKR